MEKRKRPSEVRTAREILVMIEQNGPALREMGVRKLGLFGSYRKGTATRRSDMDFLVVLARPSFDDYMAVKFFLQDLFDCEVDLVREKAIKSEMRDSIIEGAEYASGL